MEKIEATKVRRDLTELLDRIYYKNETFVVHKAGRARCLMIPLPIELQASSIPDKRRNKKNDAA